MTTRDTKYTLCPDCGGEGGFWPGHSSDPIECDTCLGDGRIKVEHPDPIILMHKEEK